MNALLNTSIITAHGNYRYEPTDLDRAVAWAHETTWTSAIGHDATAQILTRLLGLTVPVARIQYSQDAGDVCLVLKLRGRPPEGKILSREEVDAIGYDLAFLTRLS